MTAFNLLKSVLYEGRTESQGTFFMLVNDRYSFLEQLAVMFGEHVVSCDNFNDSDFSGHWFYSYFDRVMTPIDGKLSVTYRAVDEDFSITCRDGERIYLYHID